MTRIDMHEEEFDQGTEAKLKVYREYLNDWLPVFPSKNAPKIYICDYFSGPGQDSKGNPGSPMIALALIKEHRSTLEKGNTKVHLRFNDSNVSKADQLRQTINSEISKNDLSNVVTAEVTSDNFSDIYTREFDKIKEQGFPAFIFLDQFGVKYVTEDVFLRLCGIPRTDFMFFTSSSFIRRFAQEPEFSKYHPKLDAEKVKSCKHEHIHRFICEYYKLMVPDLNSTVAYPFTIRKGNTGNVYGLIFCTSHLLGAEKFLNIAWKANEQNGEANFDLDDDANVGQTSFLLANRLSKKESFAKEITNKLCSGELKTNVDILLYCLREGFQPSFAKSTVKKLLASGELVGPSQFGLTYDSAIKNSKVVTFTARGKTR